MATPGELPTFSIHALRHPVDPNTILLIAAGRIEPPDLSGLCDRVGKWLEGSEAHDIVCDVGAVVAPDAVTVDALARLQLAARRFGLRLELRHVSPELRKLLAFTGLCEAIPAADA